MKMEFEQILKTCEENTPFHLSKSDSRYERSLELEKDIGFRYEETWNLDYTLATFILPRLAYFRKELHSFPAGMTQEMWENILDTMIQGFYPLSARRPPHLRGKQQTFEKGISANKAKTLERIFLESKFLLVDNRRSTNRSDKDIYIESQGQKDRKRK